MKDFEITTEMMENARSHMPLAVKEGLSLHIADQCVIEQRKQDRDKVSNLLIPLPPLLSEDASLKALLLMNTFLTFYFDIDLPEKDEDGNDLDVYEVFDKYNDGNLLNQIERFKSNIVLRDKAFDILADFKEFRRMVDVAICNKKTSGNDPLTRLVAGLAASVFTDPAVVEEIKSRFDKLKAEQTGKEDGNDD